MCGCIFRKEKVSLATHRNVPKRVIHGPRAVLRWVHPSSAGDELQNFLVAFAGVWHVSKRKYFPQQHAERPAHGTEEIIRVHIYTRTHTHTDIYTYRDTHTQM